MPRTAVLVALSICSLGGLSAPAWPVSSALVEQVAPMPLPQAAFSTPRPEKAPVAPPARAPIGIEPAQLAPDGRASGRSVVLPETQGANSRDTAVEAPQGSDSDLRYEGPVRQLGRHRRQATLPQAGATLTGSEARVLGKPETNFQPPDAKASSPAKEVATPKTGAETAGRPVEDCRNRETAPEQPDATLVPPDRCASRYQLRHPEIASSRLGREMPGSTPEFSDEAAAIGLVPGGRFPNGSVPNPFLPLPGTPGKGLPGGDGTPPPVKP